MPTERSLAYWQRVKWVEGLVLLAAAPFLLFPDRFVLLSAAFLTLLGALWIAPLLIIRSPLIPPTPYNGALFIFCLAVCIAILVTADPDLALPKATGLILGLGVWRYLVLAVRQRSQVGWAVSGYVFLGLGIVTFGLLNADWAAKAASRVPVLGMLLSQSGTATSFVPGGSGVHLNQVAGTITLILPLLAALLIKFVSTGQSHRKVMRWAIGLATIFCGVALLLTQSRSGWAGVLGGLLVLLVLWGVTMKPSKERRLLQIGGALFVAVFLLLLVGLGPQRIQKLWLAPPQETAVGSLSTLNFRQDLWPWAVQAISDFPFTGVGLGAFREVARRLYPLPISPEIDFAHAHNVFLQVTLDLGIPGLIAYLAILLISVAVGWQLVKSEQSLRAISAGLLASLAAFHIYGLADTLALGSKSAVLLWAIFGLLAAMIRLR